MLRHGRNLGDDFKIFFTDCIAFRLTPTDAIEQNKLSRIKDLKGLVLELADVFVKFRQEL